MIPGRRRGHPTQTPTTGRTSDARATVWALTAACPGPRDRMIVLPESVGSVNILDLLADNAGEDGPKRGLRRSWRGDDGRPATHPETEVASLRCNMKSAASGGARRRHCGQWRGHSRQWRVATQHTTPPTDSIRRNCEPTSHQMHPFSKTPPQKNEQVFSGIVI